MTDPANRSRVSLLAALTLSAAACADQSFDDDASQDRAVASENGLSYNGLSYNGLSYNGLSFNGLSYNGLSYNGLSYNGLSYNGLSYNGLATPGGLSSTTGLMTTEGGRAFVKYMVKCAFPAGTSLTAQDNATPPNTYTFQGSIGVAPELQNGTCDSSCQERVSSCMLAHVNNSGLHVGIWLVGPDNGIGWGTSPDYPFQEATYFGNLFANNMPGYYCAGRDMAEGAALGRLGSAFGNNGSVLSCPYGTQWDPVSNQSVPVFCANGSTNYCQGSSEGYSLCQDPTPSGHFWAHPVTVYRNFEPTQLYKICNKLNKCLGVVGGSTAIGANIEQRAYTGGPGQTWQVLQVSPGRYKIINRTSGMALDLNGAQAVQRPYTGVASQIAPVTYIASDPGRANLVLSSLGPGAQLAPPNLVSTDGALIQALTGYPIADGSPDAARWAFQPIGPASFDPGRFSRLVPQSAPAMSIDVCNGAPTNGNCIDQYATWNGDPQKFVLGYAGNGNVKITLKLNPGKCIGPRANATVPGTQLEVQDCNGTFNQSWITGETTPGSGIMVFKNAAAPSLCMDVPNGSPANGTRIQLWTCNGANNQLFAVQSTP